MSSDDLFKEVIACARRGAKSAASNAPDPEEFSTVAGFVGEALEAQQDAPLREVEARLRREDRLALGWYLNLVRTLAGTISTGTTLQHLVFIPLITSPAAARPLMLRSAAHEIAGGLERALDLGPGTLKLHAAAVPLEQLEGMSPTQWHLLARRPQAAAGLLDHTALGAAGALLGWWTVPAQDKARLYRKLMHALQRTPALTAWKARTEALIEENLPGQRTRVFPLMLLQDLFAGLRQLDFTARLEAAVRGRRDAQALKWVWDEPTGMLTWKVGTQQGDTESAVTPFPDEPSTIIEGQLKRLATRFNLTLTPPVH